MIGWRPGAGLNRSVWRRGVGAAVGVALAAVLVAAVAIGAVVSQADAGVRWALAQATAGEVRFDALSPSWRGLVIHGVAVRCDDGADCLRIDRLRVRVRNLHPVSGRSWDLGEVRAEGVWVDLRWRGDHWSAPQETLAWLRGTRTPAESLPVDALRSAAWEAVEVDLAVHLPDGARWTGGAARVSIDQPVAAVQPRWELQARGVSAQGAWLATGGGARWEVGAAQAGFAAPIGPDLVVSLRDASASAVRLRFGEALHAEVAGLSSPAVRLADGWLSPGPALLEGLSWAVAEGASGRVATAEVRVAQVSPTVREISVVSAALRGVEVSVPAAGWGLPAAWLSWRAAEAGWTLPPVVVDALSANALVLASGDARLTLGPIAAEDLRLTDRALGWGGVSVGAMALSAGDRAVVETGAVQVPRARWRLDEALALPRATVDAPVVRLRQAAPGLGIPGALGALAQLGPAPAAIAQLEASNATLWLAGATGELQVTAASVNASGLTAGPRVALRQGVAQQVAVAVAGQRLARADRVVLGEAGEARVVGGDLWLGLDARWLPVVPPVVDAFAPPWLGGRAPADAPYFGLSWSEWPWQPRVLVGNGVVHLDDVSAGHRVWNVAIGEGQLGPVGASVPVRARGRMEGGTLAVDGQLQPSGALTLTLGAEGLDVRAFDAYVAEPLQRVGFRVGPGKASAAVTAVVTGGALQLDGDVRTAGLSVVSRRETGAVGAVAKALTGGSVRVPDQTVPLSIQGDLSDPSFSAFARVSRVVAERLATGLAGKSGAR